MQAERESSVYVYFSQMFTDILNFLTVCRFENRPTWCQEKHHFCSAEPVYGMRCMWRQLLHKHEPN